MGGAPFVCVSGSMSAPGITGKWYNARFDGSHNISYHIKGISNAIKNSF